MAEPLKNGLGPDVVALVAELLFKAWPAFPRERFIAESLDGYESLELTPRARQMSRVLRATLPEDPELAVGIIVDALPPLDGSPELRGMEPFRYLPFCNYVSDYGLGCFETSMRAQYELTQRFTCEGSIRAFIESDQERTLARLREWTSDSSEHVRRLVSEGTRPRLPWSGRLRAFQIDPTPVLELLELLKDDPSEYVRRSVANNLNDIAKDNPDMVIATCSRWSEDASEERWRIIRHALRSLVKAGDPAALAVLGASHGAQIDVVDCVVAPEVVQIGDIAQVQFTVRNASGRRERVIIDYRIHFVKANSATSGKVFKITTIDLEPGQQATFSRSFSVQHRTIRTLYSGLHEVEALVNGAAHPIGSFDLSINLD